MSNTDDLSNDYRLVDYYDRQGESMLADMLLDVINGYALTNAEQKDHDNLTNFRTLTQQWKTNGTDMNQLDESQLDALEPFAEMSYPVGSRARALLAQNHALDYAEPVLLPDLNGKSNSYPSSGIKAIKDNLMVLFPNPSSAYFTVEYRVKETYNRAKLIITDVNGKFGL